MAVAWEDEQARQVAAILGKHPPQTNECELAAKAILPIALQLDSSARAVKIKPAGRARFLPLKISLGGDPWRYHVTAEVTEHYVDSLTGPPGTSVDHYFKEHYEHDEPDIYVIQPIQL